ncbi:MAG: NAD(P)H-hydrate dehydratase [Planctomycetota bacterium]|nr:NAD(P)H-hydrate dehydratase [Planctomycetota bacterium]
MPVPLKTTRRLPAVPSRPASGHKGDFGTVIVVGGCATMFGAPALAASAAFRAGAGLVKIATSPQTLPFTLVIEPSATGIAFAPTAAGSVAAIDAADPAARAVLALGPGLGKSDHARDLVMALLAGPRRVVLDADGLNLLAQMGKPRQRQPSPRPALVMTPHPGEFNRLARPLGIELSPTDPKQRPQAAAALARAHQAIVVLKGHRTVVTDGQRVRLNTTGNPALATAGSGDVLTGLLAALLAQGLEAFDAATLAAHLHGLAADLWTAKRGPSGLTARDLANLLPDAFQKHRKK